MRRALFALLLCLLIVPASTAAASTDYQYGKPLQHENLTLVPVYPPTGTPTYNQEYLTFAEATQEGLIKVTELNGNTSDAQVSAVHVTSKTDKPIFLMAGEVILGGKQDRIISNNTIIPPRKKKLKVDVFCVEQGRWDGKKAGFRASGKVGHSKLRSKAMFEANQGAVWGEVAEQNQKSKVAPSTGTYRATLDQKEVSKDADKYVRALLPRVKADQKAIGLVVAIDGNVKSMDVFANPNLFAKMREPLVESYALTAVSSETKSDKSVTRKDLDQLNKRVAKARKPKSKKRDKASGEAQNAYYDTPDTKSAVTRSEDGAPVHEFMSVE